MHIDKDLVAASATPLVLAILAEGESYGYAILKRVRDALGGRARVDGRHALSPAPPPPEARVRRRRSGVRRREGGAASTTRSPTRARALADQRQQWAAVARALDDVWPGAPLHAAGEVAERGNASKRRSQSGGRTWPAPGVDGHDVDELEDHLRDEIAEPDRGRPRAPTRHSSSRSSGSGRRRPVPRVRARAQRPALEAALPRRRRGAGAPASGGPSRSSSRSRAGRRDPGRTPRRGVPRRRVDLAVPQRGLFVLPFLAAYFARQRRLGMRDWALTAAPFVLSALVMNLYPCPRRSTPRCSPHAPARRPWFVVAFRTWAARARG